MLAFDCGVGEKENTKRFDEINTRSFFSFTFSFICKTAIDVQLLTLVVLLIIGMGKILNSN